MLSINEIRACRPKRFIVIVKQAKPGQTVQRGGGKGERYEKEKGRNDNARHHA